MHVVDLTVYNSSVHVSFFYVLTSKCLIKMSGCLTDYDMSLVTCAGLLHSFSALNR